MLLPVENRRSVFPAYAGMIPAAYVNAYGRQSVPRIRGDDPANGSKIIASYMCSPHTRG